MTGACALGVGDIRSRMYRSKRALRLPAKMGEWMDEGAGGDKKKKTGA